MRIEAFFDGSCAPVNPGGTASYGFVIYADGKRVRESRAIVGSGPGMTNNVAEASGLSALMACIIEEFPQVSEVFIKGDSDILIRQMNGKGKKSPQGQYVPYLREAHGRAVVLRSRCFVSFQWIPREENSEADALADFRTA